MTTKDYVLNLKKQNPQNNVVLSFLSSIIILQKMALQQKDKKMLDSMIDEEIAKIPGLIRNLRLPEFQDFFGIKNESEYIYGYTHGAIVGKFETYYFVVHKGKKPSGIEVDEIAKTISQRSFDIKDKISKNITPTE